MSTTAQPTVATIARAGRLMRWIVAGFILSIGLAACSDNTSGDAVTPPPSSTPAPSVAALIGPDGGTVTGPDGVQVVVPAGALVQPTTLTVTRSAVGAPSPPPEDNSPTPIYEFLPHGLVFNKPVTIRMPVPAGATGSTAFMASPGEDWQEIGTAVAGGFAEWQRNSLSWGMVAGICQPLNLPPYSASNPDPYPCVYPRGATFASATVATDITAIPNPIPTYFGPVGDNPISWIVNQATTVQLTIRYAAAPDCQNPRVKLIRWDPASPQSTPNRVTTLYDEPVFLTPTTYPIASGLGTYVRGVGSTTYPISFSHLDNKINASGTNAFGYSFSCNRPSRSVLSGGEVLTFISAIPVPTATFTVGGMVSGLTGTGLVLQNNNAGDLAIAANGAFTFPAPVAAGAPYSVTVKTQPSGPAQSCAVVSGSGTANANVTNVAVSCVVIPLAPKAWQGEAPIEATSDTNVTSPQIAFDASGHAFAVWAKTDVTNTRNDIWANRYTPTGGWQTPQLLESGSGSAGGPHVAVDTNGNAIAVWQQTDATGQHIWANRYAGGGWSTALKIESDAGNAYSPRIGFDAAGNALVVWSQGDGALSRIRASRLTSDGWGAAVTIDDGVGSAKDPQLVVFPNGTGIAVWRGGVDHIFYNTFNGTVWSSANVLDNNLNGSTGAPQVAADATGNAIAVWRQGDGTGVTSVYASRFSAGSWGPVELMESSVFPTSALEDPRIAMNAAGDAMVVWTEGFGDGSNAWARPYKTGVGWGAPVQIDNPLQCATYEANVAIDPMGNATAVWTNCESAYTNRYTAGSAWGIPEVLEWQVGRANSPNIAMDASGNAIAIWAHTIGGSKTNVWANVYK